MIEFENIYHLYWVLPWVSFLLYLYRKQSKAFLWVSENISKRFTNSITKYNSLLKIKLHLFYLFLLGLLLIISAAGPYREGLVEDVSGKGKIILVLDGSFSMLAGDTSPHPVTSKYPQDRFAEAQTFCEELIDENPDFAYGLISFSGKPAIHSMPTNDIITIKTFIHTLLVHNFETTGSSFKSALQEILRQVYETEGRIQVILLSDGEVPEDKEENLTEEIELLKRNNVTVHTVGVGTNSPGGSVNFYVSYTEEEKKALESESTDDSTGTKKKEVDQKIIKNIKTYREDKLLRNLAKETGGHYIVIEKKQWVKDLIPFIKDTGSRNKSKIKTSGKEDLSVFFLIAFLVGFLFDGLYLFRK
ncbi:MAG: VWA domain-containing protein [Leptospiraceae bacterium]|nr:VWA domain-containing protein [Leptospiraceae bacterium]